MEAIKNIWNNRYTYAQYIAIAATILNALGIIVLKLTENADNVSIWGALLIMLGIILAFCSYCLGGLWTAIKAALGIAKWGWLVVPFPYDIATGLVAFILALAVLFLIPIIPVRKALKEHQDQQYIAQQVR